MRAKECLDKVKDLSHPHQSPNVSGEFVVGLVLISRKGVVLWHVLLLSTNSRKLYTCSPVASSNLIPTDTRFKFTFISNLYTCML